MLRKKPSTHRDLAILIHEVLDEPYDHGVPTLGYKVVRAMLSAMAQALRTGQDVNVRGFGILRVKDRTPHPTGHNILHNSLKGPADVYSSAPLSYKPRKHVVFKPSSQLRAMINTAADCIPSLVERRAMETWK